MHVAAYSCYVAPNDAQSFSAVALLVAAAQAKGMKTTLANLLLILPAVAKLRILSASASAPGMIRTCDQWFRKPLLYPLSYEGGRLVL
jgi:hypothetical protein